MFVWQRQTFAQVFSCNKIGDVQAAKLDLIQPRIWGVAKSLLLNNMKIQARGSVYSSQKAVKKILKFQGNFGETR